ncbi:hypothetical protein K4A07_18250, partial [Lactiplantibacillus plantarum]|nr:hypothetical protein [Lactiplantibacillus plantarum]
AEKRATSAGSIDEPKAASDEFCEKPCPERGRRGEAAPLEAVMTRGMNLCGLSRKQGAERHDDAA